MGIDDRLLAQPDSSDPDQSSMSEEEKEEADDELDDLEEDEIEEGQRAGQLAALQNLARRQSLLNAESGDEPEADSDKKTSLASSAKEFAALASNPEKAAVKEALSSIKKGSCSTVTGKLLKISWTNLLDSFGTSLIYIDLHLWANKFFGDRIFSNPGEEMIPEPMAKSMSKKDLAKKAKIFGTVETLGCVCLNLGCLVLVLITTTMIYFLVNPLDLAWATLKDLITKFSPF